MSAATSAPGSLPDWYCSHRVSDVFALRPPRRWLVEQLDICPGPPTLIAGYSFSGKTIFAQSLAVAVAAGLPAWGRFPCRTGRVLHLDYEQGKELTLERYERLARAAGVERETLHHQLEVVSMPPAYLDSVNMEEDLIAISRGFSLIIIDSFRAAAPSIDENSSAARIPLDMLARVSRETGVVPLVIHHARKPNQSHVSDSRMAPRGSSAIFDASASVLLLGGRRPDPVCVTHDKARNRGILQEEFFVNIEDVAVNGRLRAGIQVLATSKTRGSEGDTSQRIEGGQQVGFNGASVMIFR